MAKQKERSLGRDTILIFVFQGLTLLTGAISTIILARTLGPGGKGLIDLFVLLTTLIAELGLLGINSGLLYSLTNRRTPLAEVHGSALAYSLVAGAFICLVLMVSIGAVQLAFPGLPVHQILFAFLLSPVILYGALWSNLMVGANVAPDVYRYHFYFSVAHLAGMIVLWKAETLTPFNAIYLTGAVYLLSALISLLVLGRKNAYAFQFSPRIIGESFRYGMKIFPGLVANWLHFRIDQIMINWFVGLSGVGVYAVSVRWAESLWFIGFGVIHAGLYRIASMDRAGSYLLTKRLFKAVLVVSGVAGLILAIAGDVIIGFLYGEAFRGAVLPLIILIPGVVAWDAGRVLSQHIAFSRGRPGLCTLAALIGMAVNVGGNLWAIPRWGLCGAAAMSSASYILVIVITLFIFLAKADETDE